MSPGNFLTAVRRRKGKNESVFKEGTFVVERREHPRFRVELPLDYSLADTNEVHGGIVTDVSEGGLLVYLHGKTEIGTLLKIEILFVKGVELSPVKGVAKVVWADLAAEEAWGEYRYGLQFQSFQEGNLDKLKDLLRELGQSQG